MRYSEYNQNYNWNYSNNVYSQLKIHLNPLNKVWYYDYEKYSLSKSCNKKLLKCLEVAKWVVIMCIRFINEKNTFSVFRRTVGLIRIFALKNTSYTHFSFIFSFINLLHIITTHFATSKHLSNLNLIVICTFRQTNILLL